MKKALCLAVACSFLAGGAWLIAARASQSGSGGKKASAGKAAYIGSPSCRGCHTSPGRGAQFEIWRASRHAHAYQTLLADSAKAVAQRLRLAQPPQAAPECLRCHVTGGNAKPEARGPKFNVTEGVGCEACHGPAAEWKNVHMRDPEKARALGMLHPDEAVCRGCHNPDSPTFEGFDYAAARQAIAHPNPTHAPK